jgi:hypothetical protein
MTGEPHLLQAEHHVVRYIKPQHIDDGVINGNGFLSRPGEDAPSVNWLECFDPPLENQVAEVRRLARITYAKTGRLARLLVSTTTNYVWENSENHTLLKFVHNELEPTDTHPKDPSHALILGIPVENTPEGELVKDLIADCVIDTFPARL